MEKKLPSGPAGGNGILYTPFVDSLALSERNYEFEKRS